MSIYSIVILRKEDRDMTKKIVTIGGGTGLSTMLRGLKKYTHNITAIVTVADDGGSTGMLRDDLGILAPGDIRKCVAALAEVNPIMEELINYRFTEGTLKGHAFGNLYLAALCGISGSFEEAVNKMNELFGVEGKIIPVTNENVYISAVLSDGSIVNGEHNIGHHSNGRIKRIILEPENAKPADGVLEAISEADMIILGPGSLYTSIIPNLLVKGIPEAIKKSQATKIYVSNIMTQPGETNNHTLYDHVHAIENHAGYEIVDAIIANVGEIPEQLRNRYLSDGAEPVKVDIERFINRKIKFLFKELYDTCNGSYIRHDFNKLANTIINIK